jgi:ERCC4-type nuclease
MIPSMFLIADHREHAVLKHAKEFEGCNMKIEQITVGDYVICSNWNVVCVIERKSLEDYAASIKDGRADNKSKLLKLREETGCVVMYLIEGPEFPNPNTLYGGIPWKYIESSIFHLQMRDHIGIMRSASTLETAKLLVRFINSMSTLQKKHDFPAKSNVELLIDKTGGNTDNTTRDVVDTVVDTPPAVVDSVPTDEKQLLTMQRLQVREEKPLHDVVRSMWSVLPGIATETADSFMVHSLYDVIILKKDITGMTVHGRKINKKVLASIGRIAEYGIKMMACVPTISLATAQRIPFPDVLIQPFPGEFIVNGRKLGVRADKIIQAFKYHYVAATVI